MRQRVCIAMALACNPDVLIADEPTTALDVTTQAEILDLIKRLQVSRGMAMLLITHDMGIVAEVADDVAVMRDGEIVEMGPVDQIFHDPKHPYTQRLLAATRRLEQKSERRADNPLPATARAHPLDPRPHQDLRRRQDAVRSNARRAGGRQCRPRPLSRREPRHRRRERIGQDDARPADPSGCRAVSRLGDLPPGGR